MDAILQRKRRKDSFYVTVSPRKLEEHPTVLILSFGFICYQKQTMRDMI